MSSNNALILTGVDGSNPLGFLAALGTFRTLTRALPDDDIRMRWVQHSGAWRPEVQATRAISPDALLEQLMAQLKQMDGHRALAFADNLSVTPDDFRAHAASAMSDAHAGSTDDALVAAEFAAAFACDSIQNEQMLVQDTALRTMAGAGHQHFIAFMRHIVAHTDESQLKKALFEIWRYDDPIAKQSLRWEPSEDSRYAVQWRDPSGDPSRRERGTMLGANRLAIEGLPLMSCAPESHSLGTVCFAGRRARDTFWTWPVWAPFVSLDVCKSLIANAMLSCPGALPAAQLRAIGVEAVFRSQRITTGKFRNFTPARAVL